MTELQTNQHRLFLKTADPSVRRQGVYQLLAAALLFFGTYCAQLFHLLEKPLFSRIYYGNLNATFFSSAAAIYLFAFLIVFHRRTKAKCRISPFQRRRPPLAFRRKLIVYCMTILPVILTAAVLNFKFKIIYELGERITGMTLLGNGVSYLYAAARVLCAIYLIYLVESAMNALFIAKPRLPYGGIAAMLAFGFCDMLLINSDFAWIYLVLYCYYGIIYLVTNHAFGVTYAIAMVLYIF